MRRIFLVIALLLGFVLMPATSVDAKRYTEPIGLFDGFTGTVTAHDIEDGVPHYVTFSGKGMNVVPGVGIVNVSGLIQTRDEPLPAGLTTFQKVGLVTGNTQVGFGFDDFQLGFGFGDLTGVGWARGLNPATSFMDGSIFWPTDLLPESGDFTWTTFEGSDHVGGYRFYIEF